MPERFGRSWRWFIDVVGQEHVREWGTALAVAIVGLVAARLVSEGLYRAVESRSSRQTALLTRRGSFYLIAFLALFSALREAGFDLGVVLGAAGVLTVAVGFASQTSASNVISGIFLLGEQPFVVGDIVQIGGTRGEVVSVDLLSVKLRTPQNLYVRVPNENIIKTEVTNMTRYPIRRIDLRVGVAYDSDLERVEQLMVEVAEREPRVLVEPAPIFRIEKFGASSVEILFAVWATTSDWWAVESVLYREVKAVFDDAGIEIPFQQVVVHSKPNGAPGARAPDG